MSLAPACRESIACIPAFGVSYRTRLLSLVQVEDFVSYVTLSSSIVCHFVTCFIGPLNGRMHTRLRSALLASFGVSSIQCTFSSRTLMSRRQVRSHETGTAADHLIVHGGGKCYHGILFPTFHHKWNHCLAVTLSLHRLCRLEGWSSFVSVARDEADYSGAGKLATE